MRSGMKSARVFLPNRLMSFLAGRRLSVGESRSVSVEES
jgi:hypothetical protein